jgi:hypothetical protein
MMGNKRLTDPTTGEEVEIPEALLKLTTRNMSGA